MPSDDEFTRILQWPGYRAYRHKIDEKNKILELVANAGAGSWSVPAAGVSSPTPGFVSDLPWSEFRTAAYIEVYRVRSEI